MTAAFQPPAPTPHNSPAANGRFNPWLADLPPFDPRPVTLVGRHVTLVPLGPEHAADLLAVGREPAIWNFLPRGPLTDLADAHGFIEQALRDAAGGAQVPFALIPTAGGRAAGSSRYIDIRRPDRGLEIGWTWIGLPYQRTAVNTEAKLLLLTHAFEHLGALRVQLKTDLRNTRSQAAIERLGAVREGVLRNQVVTWTGYIRDTVMYSILRQDWPPIQSRLAKRLAT